MIKLKSLLNRFKKIINSLDYRAISKLSLIKGLGIIASIAITFIVVTELEPKNVGIYFLVLAIAKVLSIVFSLGSFAAIIPTYASGNSEDEKHILSLVLSSGIWMGLVAMTMINAIFLFLPDALKIEYWYIPIASILSATMIIQNNLFHLFSIKSMLTSATVFQEGTGRNILILTSMLFIYQVDNDLLGLRSIFFATVFGSIVLVLIGLTRFKFSLNIFSIPREILRDYFRLSINFLPSTTLLNGTSQIFEILINYFFGPVALAVLGIANKVCELFLFFSHIVNLYFVRASKLFFDDKREELLSLYIKCIGTSFFICIILITTYLLFFEDIVSVYLRLDEFPYSKIAIMVMLVSTIVQSITIFSQNLLANTGMFKFIGTIDAFNLLLGAVMLMLTSHYELILLPVAVIVTVRLIRQIACFIRVFILLKH